MSFATSCKWCLGTSGRQHVGNVGGEVVMQASAAVPMRSASRTRTCNSAVVNNKTWLNRTEHDQ
eukprot:6486535-Amphidinium_carterae.2